MISQLDSLVPMRSGVAVAKPVSINLKPGGMVCLIGPNGAGKTTLLRQLAGVTDDSPLPESLSTFYLGHSLPFYLSLTVAQQLKYWTGYDEDAIAEALAKFSAADYAKQPFGSLSKGQQQRAALSMLCLGEHDIWLLDEPTQNLDSKSVGQLYELMDDFMQRNGMIIMSTHQKLPAWTNVETCTLEPV